MIPGRKSLITQLNEQLNKLNLPHPAPQDADFDAEDALEREWGHEEVSAVLAHIAKDDFWADKVLSLHYLRRKYGMIRFQADRAGVLAERPLGDNEREGKIAHLVACFRRNMEKAVITNYEKNEETEEWEWVEEPADTPEERDNMVENFEIKLRREIR